MTATTSESLSSSDTRRAVLDYVLAGLICLAATGYWLWDTWIDAPQASVTVTAALPNTLSDNDEGYRLYSASDYVGAEARFRNAIRANPNEALGYCNLGAALIAEQKFDEAIAVLERAIALNPSLALARNNLAWALQEKEKHGK
jgi:tetratricopeptide (TPR) repeat protein